MKIEYMLIVLAFSSPASDIDTGFAGDVIEVVHTISDHASGPMEQIS